MIDGYIEIVTGVGKNSRSVTVPFNDKDAGEVASWAPQVAGVTLDTPLALRLNSRDIPAEHCAGIWLGTTNEGKQASIRVWISQPD